MHDRQHTTRGLALVAIVIFSVVAGPTAVLAQETASSDVSVSDGWDSAEQVGPGQTELVQYVTVTDSGDDENDTTVTSLTIQGVESMDGKVPAEADDIASIDIYLDGVSVGSASPTAFRGEQIEFDLDDVTVPNGETIVFEIYVTVSEEPTDDHYLQLISWVETNEGTDGPIEDVSADKIDSEPPYMSGAISFVNDGVTDAGASETSVEVRFAEPLDLTGNGPVASDFAVLRSDGSAVTPDAVYDYEGDSLSEDWYTVFLDLGEINPNHLTAVHITDSADFEDTEGNAVDPETIRDESIRTTSHTFSEDTSESEIVYRGERIAMVGADLDTSVGIRTGSGTFMAQRSTGPFTRVATFDTSGLTLGETYTIEYESSSPEDEFLLADLDLTVTLNQPEITERQTLRGTVTAADGNREVAVRLFDNTGDLAASRVLTLDGSGAGTFAFSGLDPGRYSLEAEDLETGLTADVGSIRVHQVSSSSGSSYSSAEAAFPQDRFTEERGDVARLSLNITGASDYATLTIGSQEADYHVEVDLREGDDDDRVALDFDTYHPGLRADGTFSIPDGSDDEIESVTYVSGLGEDRETPLPVMEYDLSVTATYSGDDEQDTATLELLSRSSAGIATWVAPAGAQLDNAENITAAATQRDTVAKGDSAIVQVEASGLGGLIGDSDYSLAELTATNYTDGVSLTIEQTGVANGTSPETIDVTSGTLVTDLAEDQFFVVFDTTPQAWLVGETYEAAFVVNGSSPHVANETVVERFTTAIEIVDARTEFDGADESGTMTLPPDADAGVSGTGTMAPGTNISVTLNATCVEQTNENITIQDDGTWSTAFDLSACEEGSAFTVSSPLAVNQTGVVQVGEPEPEPTGEPAFEVSGLALSQTEVRIAEDFDVTGTVANTGTANGTYVANLVVDGQVATTQQVFVPEGGTADFTVTYELVTPGEYTVILDGTVLGTVTVLSEPTTTTTTTTTTATPTTPSEPTTSMLPLYGVVALLMAGLGAMFLIRR